MLKVAIVGCGKIADSHAEQILRVPGSEIVGVCDREPLMAKQLFERFPVGGYFTELHEMIEKARPDVVHIATSPESHFNLASQCLEAGCHVYVEKPFALCEADSRKLIDLAVSRGLKITVGHDDQFSHVARRMRTLIEDGYLGGPAVHMESYYCYEFAKSPYALALIRDPTHWVRRLPGKLLQNVISHGIARIAEHLTTDSPTVIAHGYTSLRLRELGETELVDEVRVIISDGERTAAYFTFSSQMRPVLHQFRIYGPRNGLILDQDQETLIRLRGNRAKSYLETFATPMTLAKQYCDNVFTNLRTFMASDLQTKSGMKHLIERFYGSIVDGGAVPIPYREIILTARIMDSIFSQLDQKSAPGRNLDDEFAALTTKV